MPEHDTPADDASPIEPPADDTLTQLARTNDPATLFSHDKVTTETAELEVGRPRFEQNQMWDGIVMTGLTNDAGDVLLVYDADPDSHHEWVLPHGVVEHDESWLETAIDWVDGLTGITPDHDAVVHVRRNDLVLESDPEQQTTTYHVFLSGSPQGAGEIDPTPRYDWAVKTAAWHDVIPETGREQEHDDIAQFVDHTDSEPTMRSPQTDGGKDAVVQMKDPAACFERDDVTTDVVEIETDAEHFERYQDWKGMAIAGITNDDGDVLLVKNTDPDVCHDWVLPHGAVREDEVDWAETAADWVDGLTGVSATIDDVVHVRRNDITLGGDDEDADGEQPRETTTYHVIFSGQPHDNEVIQDDARYDCDGVRTAEWHTSVPESTRETESQDIDRFVH